MPDVDLVVDNRLELFASSGSRSLCRSGRSRLVIVLVPAVGAAFGCGWAASGEDSILLRYLEDTFDRRTTAVVNRVDASTVKLVDCDNDASDLDPFDGVI